MKKRMMALLLTLVMVLSVLAGCGKEKTKIVTEEEAQQIALKAAGLTAKQVSDIHTHVVSYEDVPCYSIHITVGSTEYEYVIAAATGEILMEEAPR